LTLSVQTTTIGDNFIDAQNTFFQTCGLNDLS
jgi:hypothetical protein